MDISTSMNVLFDPEHVSVIQALERLVQAGFRHLDFNFVDWCYPGSPFVGDDWERWVDGVARRAQTLGVRFTQAHGPIFNRFEDTERCHWLTALSPRSVEGAAMLGVPWIVFEPETLPGPAAFDVAHLQETRQRNLDWFDPLVTLGEDVGVGLALENVMDQSAKSRGTGRRYCATPAELADLVDAFSHGSVGICWDTGHAHMQRLDQVAALGALGTRIKALHVQDNNGEMDQHLPPYAVPRSVGIDWPPLVAVLGQVGYAGDFTFEVGGAIRGLPDPLRDDALRSLYRLGEHLLA